eukprot:103201_1
MQENDRNRWGIRLVARGLVLQTLPLLLGLAATVAALGARLAGSLIRGGAPSAVEAGLRPWLKRGGLLGCGLQRFKVQPGIPKNISFKELPRSLKRTESVITDDEFLDDFIDGSSACQRLLDIVDGVRCKWLAGRSGDLLLKKKPALSVARSFRFQKYTASAYSHARSTANVQGRQHGGGIQS